MGDDDLTRNEFPDITPPDDDDIITGTPDPDARAGRYDDTAYDDADDYDYEGYQNAAPRKKKKHGTPYEAPVTDEPRRKRHRWPLMLSIGCMALCCLCCILPLCAVATVGGGLAAFASNSEMTVSSSQTLDVDPDTPINLTIDNSLGSVTIERGSTDDAVQIDTTKRAYGWNKSRAETELNNIAVQVQQDDDDTNAIDITVDTSGSNDSLWSNANNVEMVLHVPEHVHLAITNDVGAINIRDVVAESLDLKTNVGGIQFNGELSADPDATFRAETNTGGTAFKLPVDAYVRIDATVAVGDVEIEDTFDGVRRDDPAGSSNNTRWLGVLGRGDDDPPTLVLRSDTGGIIVEVR